MAEISYELYNNQLIQKLVGINDANLKVIEKTLGVEILSFGNQITIKGGANEIENAKTAIMVLYDKASKNVDIGEEEVKAAVRICSATNNEKDLKSFNEIVLKTKKRYIYPRSATQAEYIDAMLKN